MISINHYITWNLGDSMPFNSINSEELLLKYMQKNITYGFVTKNGKKLLSENEWHTFEADCLVQTGNSILNTQVGTCWDQVELERLWFTSHNYHIKTYFLYFEGINNTPTHTFLLYEKNNNWYWFENAFESYRGIHAFKDLESAINKVKECHLKYTLKNHKVNENSLKIKEYQGLTKNLSINDFLKHVLS